MSTIELRRISSLICLLLIALVGVSAQTSFYKRTKIVQNGNVRTCADDGHYITITSNRAYDSDKDGYQLSGSNMKYSKTEDNIRVYYGKDYHGACNWFISLDGSRINAKLPDGTIYVYERCSPSSNIAMRSTPRQSEDNGIQNPIPQSVNQSSDMYKVTPVTTPAKQRKTCPYCKGTGIGMDKITYDPGYDKEYCQRCGKWGFKHRHQDMMCRTCYGKGYIEY